jgi:hypothetical protein
MLIEKHADEIGVIGLPAEAALGFSPMFWPHSC